MESRTHEVVNLARVKARAQDTVLHLPVRQQLEALKHFLGPTYRLILGRPEALSTTIGIHRHP